MMIFTAIVIGIAFIAAAINPDRDGIQPSMPFRLVLAILYLDILWDMFGG